MTDIQFEELTVTISELNYTCLTNTLYNIGISHENINRSIMAVKGLNRLTAWRSGSISPYGDGQQMGGVYEIQTHRKIRQPGEVPNFPTMQKWWKEVGSKIEEHNCPLAELLIKENEVSFIEQQNAELIEEKREYFKVVSEKYFGLARMTGNYGYLSLYNEANFSNIEKQLDYLQYKHSSEPLIHLTLAYIKVSQNNFPEAQNFIDQCIKVCGANKTIETLEKHNKFALILKCEHVALPALPKPMAMQKM